MKTIITLLTVILISMNGISQTQNKENLKIIYQYTVKDTAFQRTFMKQLANIQKVAPGTKIEIVCHGPGLELLQKEKSLVADKIAAFVESGVVFNACEFAMSERKIVKDQMIPSTTFVKAGIIEIATKQSEGWSYIKAGF
jgi:intracellular sulfur oxidation DsrE/DsrF family protein